MKKIASTLILLWLITLGLLISLNMETIKSYAQDSQEIVPSVNITFLDIGQGDATFIEFADGQQMLIDCAIDGRVLESLAGVMPFFDKTLDYLVITHPDKDHYGGCEDVLERFEVSTIIYNGFRRENNSTWRSFWDAIVEEQAEYVGIDVANIWEIASSTITFLYPDHEIAVDPNIPNEKKEANNNDMSIVMKLSYGEMDVLFTGDAEEALEQYLVYAYGDVLDVEILKMGHHGSARSSIEEFIEVVTPEEAIASAGEGNRYGHPSPRAIKRLERAGAHIWRTDTQGDIMVTLYETTYDIVAEY